MIVLGAILLILGMCSPHSTYVGDWRHLAGGRRGDVGHGLGGSPGRRSAALLLDIDLLFSQHKQRNVIARLRQARILEPMTHPRASVERVVMCRADGNPSTCWSSTTKLCLQKWCRWPCVRGLEYRHCGRRIVAIASARAQRPDVVVLDVMLPT